ncbi:serine/threonine-protein kinase 31 [Bufo gargarizans]|uniref:serine/threonine-protein kinase 31 n=1 Tax=Bufo gargarizans TaxID=30331 RepID=UPI001CF34048|nr:serine/threonine-protein kinase 31 [Bufo gargarizans]
MYKVSKMEGESSYNKAEVVYVSHVEDAVTFWGQAVHRIHDISEISESLAKFCPTMNTVFGVPDLDKVYGGLFSADKCWYRCKLLHVVSDEQCAVCYIDYGNSEVLARSSIVELPEELQSPPIAQKHRLWGLQLQSASDVEQGLKFLSQLISDKQVSVQQKAVYKDGTVVVQVSHNDLDIGEEVAKKGFAVRSRLISSPNSALGTVDAPAHEIKLRFPWQVRNVERLPIREPKSLPVLIASSLSSSLSLSRFLGLWITVIPYLNDILIKAPKQLASSESTQIVLHTIARFGWIVNHKKSSLRPSPSITFLGILLDTEAAKVFLLLEKHRALLPCHPVPFRKCIQTLGLMVVSVEAVLFTPFYIRSLQQAILRTWDKTASSLNRPMLLSATVRQSLHWWLHPSYLSRGKSSLPLNWLVLTTDARLSSWGGVFLNHIVQGQWFPLEAKLPINILELHVFDLKSDISLGSCDDVSDIDNILEKVDTSVSKELEISLVEPGEDDRNIITNAYNRVVKLIYEETCLISALKAKYQASVEFKKNMSEWINKNPNVDDLLTVKKSIKVLKAELRWKLHVSSSMEESDEYNATAHTEVKHEIETIRSKIFSEIQREQEEYALLSNLAQKWFPELPLIYSDVGITNYMHSGGLLSGSMERVLFDAEPLKELSSKRPLVCTQIQNQKVLLKGYSVGVDTEEQVIVRASKYHKAWLQQKEESGIMQLLYLFFCKFDPVVYLMVPFYPGENLGCIQASNKLSSHEIVRVMRGVALGLHTLHASNIVLGSLHENNVFAVNRERGIVGDIDFTRDAEQRSSATSICFPMFTAPEIKLGQPASASSDVYAYGVLLLWLCTGSKNVAHNSNGTPDLKKLDLVQSLSKSNICYPLQGSFPQASYNKIHGGVTSLRPPADIQSNCCVQHGLQLDRLGVTGGFIE